MNRGKKAAKIILVLAAALLAGRFIQLRGETTRILALDIPNSLGMDTELQQLVKELEKNVEARNRRKISMKSDPLKLSRIITNIPWKSTANPEHTEGPNTMRLSCTVLSPGKALAIIKYRGKSHTLKVGDSLAGRHVKKISNKQVVMEIGGKEMILVNKPAPPSEIRAKYTGSLEELEL